MPSKIYNNNFSSDFFVISDYLLSVEVILGLDVLQQGEIKFNISSTEFAESETNTHKSNENFCLPIKSHAPIAEGVLHFSHDSFTGFVESSTLSDLIHISVGTVQSEILQLIKSYTSMKN